MINTVRKFKAKLRNKLLYLIKTRRRHKRAAGAKSAIINVDKHFSDDDLGRYTLIICNYFEHAGFRIIVKTNRHFFHRVNKYKRVLLNKKYSFVRNCTTPVNSIVVYNGTNEGKTIQLDYGHELAHSKMHDCVVSYPLHPNLYQPYPPQERFASLRSAHRVMNIFFSGNVDVKNYNRDQLEEKFSIMNRVQIINFINEKFQDSGKLMQLDRKEQLNELLEGNAEHKKIFINTDKTDNHIWLEVLSKCNFFLCAPGVRMPWAHNMSESMAVGTIPILQYANWCSPPLHHNENCLAFTDAEDLYTVIEVALQMPQEEITRMRKNAINYYEEHLSLASVVNKIDRFINSEQEKMTVAIPFIPAK